MNSEILVHSLATGQLFSHRQTFSVAWPGVQVSCEGLERAHCVHLLRLWVRLYSVGGGLARAPLSAGCW